MKINFEILILTFPIFSFSFILLLKASAWSKIYTLCMTTPPAYPPSLRKALALMQVVKVKKKSIFGL